MEKSAIAKPFLKWAGGKTQLLDQIVARLPKEFSSNPFIFIEPFVGGGALLFHLLNRFPKIEKVIINDLNEDLITTYETIKNDVSNLIVRLEEIEKDYYKVLDNKELSSNFYYSIREKFNRRNSNDVNQSAYFIFLNRTCFNGLYRVNKSNKFNVPKGDYKNPRICDSQNLRLVSNALQKVQINCGDYFELLKDVEEGTFIYLDPPYKPLSKTSNFNHYTNVAFDDLEQSRLLKFCESITTMGAFWIQSNSNHMDESGKSYFKELYSEFQVDVVSAKRMINTYDSNKKHINEVLIYNSLNE